MLTCNQKDETLRCLTELKKVITLDHQLKTILVDNASQDDTASAIKKIFPQIKLIINQENRGFAAGVNQGLKLALKDKEMKFVLLLNNDTFLNKNFLKKLLEVIQKEKKIGLIAPALKHYQNNKLFYGMEGYLDLRKGLAKHRNVRVIKNKKIIEADFLSGCCLLIRREVLEKIGLFDERFYLYLEDVDYCLRVRQAGYKAVLDPKIVIGHKVSAGFKNPLRKLPYSFWSNLIFIHKWTPWPYKISAWLHCLYFYPFLALLWSLTSLSKASLTKR